MIRRAAELRHRAVANRLREVDSTGAREFVTSCTGCRASFEDAAQHMHRDQSPASLLELVAQHLES